jgi:signal transduction histidine kinase
MKRFWLMASFLTLVTAMPLFSFASERAQTLDPLLDQWYRARDALIAHVDEHFNEQTITGLSDDQVLAEIRALGNRIVDLRRKPTYHFMMSSDPSLDFILKNLEGDIVQVTALLASDHSPAEVLRSISSLQSGISDYMHYRIVFSEKVTRYYLFLIMFFVSVCILIIVLVAVFRSRLSSLERDEANTSNFARTVINAQESERIAIARELHDTVAQDILCIKVATETMRNSIARSGSEYEAAFAELIENEAACINRIREVCAELRPPELVHLGLKAAVNGLCAGFEKANGIPCGCTLFGEYTLGYEEEINCYRIIQEALTNVRKHARATAVSVRTDIVNEPGGGRRLTIRVSDNGIGIPSGTDEASAKTAFGLKGMQERVRILRGEMSIVSEASGGTTVSVSIPLTAQTTDGYNESDENPRVGR